MPRHGRIYLTFIHGSFYYAALQEGPGDGGNRGKRVNTPALRKSQAEIRRRFSPKEMPQYARLRRLKPDCIVED